MRRYQIDIDCVSETSLNVDVVRQQLLRTWNHLLTFVAKKVCRAGKKKT